MTTWEKILRLKCTLFKVIKLSSTKQPLHVVPVLFSARLHQIIQICQKVLLISHSLYISWSNGRVKLGKGAYSSFPVLFIEPGFNKLTLHTSNSNGSLYFFNEKWFTNLFKWGRRAGALQGCSSLRLRSDRSRSPFWIISTTLLDWDSSVKNRIHNVLQDWFSLNTTRTKCSHQTESDLAGPQ